MILKFEVKSNNSFKINELYNFSATCVHRVANLGVKFEAILRFIFQPIFRHWARNPSF
jgi:hypothetical protein